MGKTGPAKRLLNFSSTTTWTSVQYMFSFLGICLGNCGAVKYSPSGAGREG